MTVGLNKEILSMGSNTAQEKKNQKRKPLAPKKKPAPSTGKKESKGKNTSVKSLVSGKQASRSSYTVSGKKANIKEGAITLKAENLKKVYGKNTVVRKVSYKVTQGEVVGLLGPNGAGKTTSFYMTVGLVRATQGEIFLGDMNITNMPMYMRARHGIGYLAQEASIFRTLSVRQNIESILEIRKLPKDKIKEEADRLLKELEIEHVQNGLGITLSGGERRRAEIARALASEPKFLLLDEPFAGVDPIAVKDIQKVIEQLREKDIGILITDHNVRETLKITDRAYIMFEGELLIEGTADVLINDPRAKEIYLGNDFTI